MSDLIDIDVRLDRVIILGMTIMRPDSISPVQWFDFWERYKKRR